MKSLVEGVWRVLHPLVKKLSRKTTINETIDEETELARKMHDLSFSTKGG